MLKRYLLYVIICAVGATLTLPSRQPTAVARETTVAVAPQQVEVQKTVEVAATPAPEPDKPRDCSIVYNYDWPHDVAYAVCMAESRGDPAAVGDTRVIGGIYAPSYGLMQIRALPGRPEPSQLLDPHFNVQYAYNMWRGQGWQPWSAYTQGWYLNYM